MMIELPRWPVAKLEQALQRLGNREASAATFGPIAETIVTPREVQTYLYAAASREGLDVEPLNVQGDALEPALRTAGSVLVVIYMGVLALKQVRGKHAVLLCPEGGETVVPFRAVCDAVRWLWELKYELTAIDAAVQEARVAASRKASVRSALSRLQLASRQIEVGWVVRPAAGAAWRAQFAHSRQHSNLIKLVLSLLAVQATSIAAWYLLGRGALTGSFDRGWLWGWAIALVSGAVLTVLASFWEGAVSIAFGAKLKTRLMLGALRLSPGALRQEGLGRSMSRVLETTALQELSLAGGFLSIIAFVELLVAMAILLEASTSLFVSFLAAVVLMLWACVAYYRATAVWTGERLTLTHDLIERLVGHRTRVTQGDPAQLHEEEDVALQRYAHASQAMDRIASAGAVLIPRGGLLVGLCGLAPLFLKGVDAVSLWVGMGGVLLAQRALTRLASGISTLFEAAVAWKSAALIVNAARIAEEPATELGLAASLRVAPVGETLLEARRLDFRFTPATPTVLRGVTLQIRSGDRLLIEGPSGSGKSAFASILAGLRPPQHGLLLLSGLDRHTLGASVWRKKVSAAPQHHENHILQGSLAFNLLLGREWPASPDELLEAEDVCEELGLGDLLARMPSRLMQTVGSTGWRLSHGEQSRIFIARALLQGSEIVILDESLAALDPENVSRTLACIRKRARTLIVVAHP